MHTSSVAKFDTAAAPISLAHMPTQAVARVHEIRAENGDAARLKALGICAGRRVQLVQAGDPLIVRAVGIRIGLSQRLAELVLMGEVEEIFPKSDANESL